MTIPSQTDSMKWMTTGEAGLGGACIVTVFLAIIASAKAEDAAYGFHAAVFGIAALAALFAILNRYFERGELPPKEIAGRPNYKFGPIKFASVAAMGWGIAGFLVGLLIAAQLAW